MQKRAFTAAQMLLELRIVFNCTLKSPDDADKSTAEKLHTVLKWLTTFGKQKLVFSQQACAVNYCICHLLMANKMMMMMLMIRCNSVPEKINRVILVQFVLVKCSINDNSDHVLSADSQMEVEF